MTADDSSCRGCPPGEAALPAQDDETPATRMRPGHASDLDLPWPAPPPAPLEPEWDDENPYPTWDRYQLLELIGQGGMGRVYKARDPRLGRLVAVKILRRNDPEVVRRFTREAQAQAKVDHDNVCPVYEVGEVEGRPYIAMQYVAGGSLKEVRDLLDLRAKVAVMVDIADALHAAHRQGLVHRDVKPANILVEPAEEGGWRSFVVDFGIVRDLAADDLTATGMVVGTPAFSAPEQVRGESARIGPASDVYGLGATLYWFVTGRSPFEGNLSEIVSDVTRADPTPPHRIAPEIPVDLETIILTCLEKRPEGRYESARAVSEDLRRFLAGDPIVAQPPILVRRLARVVRRHRALAVTATVALFGMLLLGALNLRSNLQARQRTALVQRLIEQVKEIESLTRIASMMPRHDRRPEQRMIRARLARIEAEIESADQLAAGPGSYALGRGHLVLGDYRTARDLLERAVASGYDTPAVAYARGLVLGKLYEQELDAARRIEDETLRTAALRRLESELKAPALRLLRSSAEVETEAPALVEGLIAYYERRYSEALERARTAFAQAPWLYEARRLEGDVHFALGASRRDRGDYRGALDELEQAGTAYATAAGLGRSDPAVYEADCARWIEAFEARRRLGLGVGLAFREGVAACGRSLEVDPDRATVHEKLALLGWRWADHQLDGGGDPSPTLERAIADAERAIALDPALASAFHTLGGALTVEASFELGQGRDPRPVLERAAEAFERAIALDPTSVLAHDDLGYAWERRARYEMSTGGDPTASLERAILSYRRAIALDAGYANAHNNLGIALWRLAVYQLRRGDDPTESLEKALNAYQEAIARNPNYAYARANLGLAYRTMATAALGRDSDPGAWLERARAALDRALSINSSIAWAYPEQVAVELLAARWQLRRGESPAASFTRARAASERALRLNPQSAMAEQSAAELDRWRATWRLAEGGDPAAEIVSGLVHAARALELNPSYAAAMLSRAALLALEAEASPDPATRAGAQRDARHWIERALAANPLLDGDARPILDRMRHPSR